MTDLTLEAIRGRWELVAWEMHVGDTLTRPLGEHSQGVIYYADDGGWASRSRAPTVRRFASTDPLGGTEQERAAAYVTYLAYCGTYEIRDGRIVHNVRLSTFPNWAGRSRFGLSSCTGIGLSCEHRRSRRQKGSSTLSCGGYGHVDGDYCLRT